MSHRTRIMILVIAAVLPWTMVPVNYLVNQHPLFPYISYIFKLILLLTLLQVIPTFLIARGFKRPWQFVLGTFLANHYFLIVGWWCLGLYIYNACRENG